VTVQEQRWQYIAAAVLSAIPPQSTCCAFPDASLANQEHKPTAAGARLIEDGGQMSYLSLTAKQALAQPNRHMLQIVRLR
jgi:hypothetical protein